MYQRIAFVSALIVGILAVFAFKDQSDVVALVIVDEVGEPIGVVDIESDGTGESSQSFRVLAIRNDGTTKNVTIPARADIPAGAPFTYSGRGTVNARPLLYGEGWLILTYDGTSAAVQVAVLRRPLLARKSDFDALDDGEYPFREARIYDPGSPNPWMQEDNTWNEFGNESVFKRRNDLPIEAKIVIFMLTIAGLIGGFILLKRKPRTQNKTPSIFRNDDRD